MKNYFQKPFIFLMLILLFSGCIRLGRPFPIDPVRQLEIGKTHKDDALTMFGTPWKTGVEDGDETWTYGCYQYTLFGKSKNSGLVLRFNEMDTLISYTYNCAYKEEENDKER